VNDFSQVNRLAFDIGKVTAEAQVLASKAVRKTLFDIEADAKQLAPVDTGNLRNSISSDITGDGRHGAMSAEIGPTAEYGVYQEYGTSTQPGQPFLGPAYDRRAPALEAMLGRLADGLR
jgi:HK97 gp10 family phage protein